MKTILRNVTVMRALQLLMIIVLTSPAWAGAPILLKAPGVAMVWANGGRSISYSTDLGGLGTLTNAEALAQTAAAVSAWEGVPTATVSFIHAGSLPVNVDESNFVPWLFPAAPDGISPVVYDETGAFFDLIFGPFNGILGFSGPEWEDSSTGTILEGRVFINGAQMIDGFFPPSEFLGIQVHEFGHFLNLDHSVVNGQVGFYLDNTGPTPYDAFPPIDLHGHIETMYPFAGIGTGEETPDKDDAAILSLLYPEPGFSSSTGTITGTVYLSDGVTRVDGVNVIARNIADPFGDAVSTYTGQFSLFLDQSDPFTGVFKLAGLTPGATYVVYVDRIINGSFAVPPAGYSNPFPGFEEFYNGSGESADFATDDPQASTGVTVTAGGTASGIDIIFNAIKGPIPIGDNEGVYTPLPFAFNMCGIDQQAVVINPNGELGFSTEADPTLVENVPYFLNWYLRIAAAWHDFNPAAGGVVSVDPQPDTFRVSWENVPEYPDIGSNTFSITLHRASSQIELTYGDMSVSGAITGFSCGDFVTNQREPASDLSALAAQSEGAINGRGKAALYEQFDGSNLFDLANQTLSLTVPREFKDLYEPNNSLKQATRVLLPFNSANQFTAISEYNAPFPPPKDVDFFRFRASAGTTLVAETQPGESFFPTLLGLFDVTTGKLLAVGDFGTGVGNLAHLSYPITQDGLYAIAVTMWPDYGFTGSRLPSGRYILDIRATPGAPLEILPQGTKQRHQRGGN